MTNTPFSAVIIMQVSIRDDKLLQFLKVKRRKSEEEGEENNS